MVYVYSNTYILYIYDYTVQPVSFEKSICKVHLYKALRKKKKKRSWGKDRQQLLTTGQGGLIHTPSWMCFVSFNSGLNC